VIETSLTEREIPETTEEEQQQLENEVTTQTRALEYLCKQIDAAGDINYTYLVEAGPDLVRCISRVAEDKQIDLIIMGTKGDAGGDDFVFGTVTSGVIEQASCPVLAIPEHIRLDKKIEKISYATALLQGDLKTLETVAVLAKLYDAELNLLHVYDETDPNTQPEEAVSGLWQLAKQAAEHLHYERLSCEMLTASDVGEGLLQFVKSGRTDLLALSSRRRRYFGRLLNTSLSVEMARQIEVPLLVFHHQED
jgi:nucleotide-binding universal stress UspA family protein